MDVIRHWQNSYNCDFNDLNKIHPLKKRKKKKEKKLKLWGVPIAILGPFYNSSIL